MSIYNQVLNNLEELELIKMKEMLPVILDQNNKAKQPLSTLEILQKLTSSEIVFRDERAKRVNITISSFPFVKTLKDFDYQPQINRSYIEDLATLRFMKEHNNIVFMGSPGVGKSHLAIAEKREETIIKHYLKYSLLIIDEIGYLPKDKETSYVFFQLIAARDEKRSTILTTNQPFSKWGDVFGDNVIASAIIDRLVHHCEIIKISGLSYRLKGRNIFDNDEN